MSAAYCQRTRNPLLVKDDVGSAKPSCYRLPPEDFAYGRPDMPDYEGAREVTMQWVSHHAEERRETGVQDFRKLNKAALKNKVIDSRKLTDFRRNHSAPLLLSNPTGPPPKVFPSEVVPSFTYGKKTRPSTPIAQVVSNQFAAEYQASLEEIYDYYEKEKKEKKAPVIRTTKAAEGHARKFLEMEKPPPKEKFILSRFKNIPGKLHLPGKTLSKSATAPKQITVQPAADVLHVE